TDSLRVFVGGYAQRDLDNRFGRQFSLNAYDAAIEILKDTYIGTGDNQDLGGAVSDVPIATAFNMDQGPHIVDNTRPPDPVTGQPRKNPPVNTVFGLGFVCPDPVLTMFFTVTFVPRPPQILTS